jgi:prepilin-type N-terminal cleavage/methylation domain-containing protein
MRSSFQPLNRQGKGFTLVELMVVIAIILVLMAASVGVVFKFLSSQKQAATQRTVDQVNSAIERVLKNIRTRAHTDYASLQTAYKAELASVGQALATNGLIGLSEPNRIAELMYVNLQIARTFPKHFGFVSNSTTSLKVFNTSTATVLSSEDEALKTLIFEPVVENWRPNGVTRVKLDFINNKFAGLASNPVNAIPSLIQSRPAGVSVNPNLTNFLSQYSIDQIKIFNSACLLIALESNSDGLKGENLGSAVMTDNSTGSPIRYLATGDGQPICFQLKYLDSKSGGSNSVVGTVSVNLLVP